jgi:putrescine transport system permease protein
MMARAGENPRRGPLSKGQRLALAAPYAWILLFFLAPFALIAKISLSRPAQTRPPYEPTFDLAEGWSGLKEKIAALGFDAYRGLIEDSLYLDSYLSSLAIASVATAVTVLVAYPFALAMARAPRRWRPVLIGFAVAPFWTSFLVRVYAWIALLKDEGIINHLLLTTKLIDAPLPMFATSGAVVVSIVYSYLPFMLLPLYAAIERQDPALREAAADLGAPPWQVFWRVTWPLSRRGVVAGSLLVFIPAVGEFVIPDLLGGSDTLMIGRTLWNDFFANRDWPAACAVAIALVSILIVPILYYERAQLRAGEERN